MYEVPGSGDAVGTGTDSSAATGAGLAWRVVAGLVLARAARGRRATADE
ncbi:peptidase [Actinosynnema sp. NPDC023794]